MHLYSVFLNGTNEDGLLVQDFWTDTILNKIWGPFLWDDISYPSPPLDIDETESRTSSVLPIRTRHHSQCSPSTSRSGPRGNIRGVQGDQPPNSRSVDMPYNQTPHCAQDDFQTSNASCTSNDPPPKSLRPYISPPSRRGPVRVPLGVLYEEMPLSLAPYPRSSKLEIVPSDNDLVSPLLNIFPEGESFLLLDDEMDYMEDRLSPLPKEASGLLQL
ncbi:hypothetical protein CONPUDRAFT_73388 [Coniophora puteana RWD-64-598 SS2]|uniref:Uncharacterized protein n=1 Tax=Coniophora puteana (strain RWD-64-598) TaxID=741705 RepID=A0A5M3MMF0_CONPW|nr:uncharacterized protein CONPUDRAFT_73388 [Coniophora puteana RWD-64-598 SS2]EIW80207.1 hypothetical protein CONPUDRAFT_73388 [Coniophora puteana RWD-64-598 SS2]